MNNRILDQAQKCYYMGQRNKVVEVKVFGKPINYANNLFVLPDILNFLKEKNITKLFCPDTAKFSGVIAKMKDFRLDQRIQLVHGVQVLRHDNTEGLAIGKGAAAFFCSADCPTVILRDGKTDLLIAAHAGLGSIIDREKITNWIPSRRNESVVDDFFLKYRIFAGAVNVKILCGIKQDNFKFDVQDPKWGEINKKILNYLQKHGYEDSISLNAGIVRISVPGIIRQQLIKNGIYEKAIEIDSIDTYSDVDKQGSHLWWSHRRFIDTNEGADGRNGVLIIHH